MQIVVILAGGADDQLHHGVSGRGPAEDQPGGAGRPSSRRARPGRSRAAWRSGLAAGRCPGAPEAEALEEVPGSLDDSIELLVGADVEPPETFEELSQVLDGRVSKDLGLPVVGPGESLGEMLNQPGELLQEGLLRQLNGLVEPGLDPLTLLLVEGGIELLEVVRRFHRGEVPGHRELVPERNGVVGWIEQPSQPIPRRLPELGVGGVEV